MLKYKSRPGGSLVCGLVNAKNALGGYVGYAPFMAYFRGDGRLMALKTHIDVNDFKWARADNSTAYALKVMYESCKF